MFDKATRQKIRFNTPAGQLSVEDLWDLPLTSPKANNPNLDSIAIQLDKELKDSSVTSFVTNTSKSNELAKLKFDVVLHVIQVRKSEAEAAELRKSNADKKQRLLELMAKKQDAALEGKSLEELQAMVSAL